MARKGKDTQGLPTRWRILCNQLEVGIQSRPDDLLRDLMAQYRQGWRAYHTITHIKQILKEFDEFCAAYRTTKEERNVIQLATWYHDVEYMPQARDNEARSVEYFRAIAQRLYWNPGLIAAVTDAILATKHLRAIETKECFTSALVCDLDLVILGERPMLFEEYETQIRTEYYFLAEADFRKARAAILRRFLDRPFIYAHPFFREKYEARAHMNLHSSIGKLLGPARHTSPVSTSPPEERQRGDVNSEA
jgi:predicted metal-dependent HD superfamily phosphohydrolase